MFFVPVVPILLKNPNHLRVFTTIVKNYLIIYKLFTYYKILNYCSFSEKANFVSGFCCRRLHLTMNKIKAFFHRHPDQALSCSHSYLRRSILTKPKYKISCFQKSIACCRFHHYCIILRT